MATAAPEAAPEADRPEAGSSTDYEGLMAEAKAEVDDTTAPEVATAPAPAAISPETPGATGPTTAESGLTPMQSEWEESQGRSVDISRMLNARTPEKAAKEREVLVGRESEIAEKFDNATQAGQVLLERLRATGMTEVASQVEGDIKTGTTATVGEVMARHGVEQAAVETKERIYNTKMAKVLTAAAKNTLHPGGGNAALELNRGDQPEAKQYITELREVLGLQHLSDKVTRAGHEIYFRSNLAGWENSLMVVTQDPKTGEIRGVQMVSVPGAVEQKRPSILHPLQRWRHGIVDEAPSKGFHTYMDRYVRSNGSGPETGGGDGGDGGVGQPRKRRPRR